MPSKSRLGNKIRRLRDRAGLTQAQLAGELEISTSYLNLLENNKRGLTVPLLLRIAERFGLELKDLSEDEDAQLLAELTEIFADAIFQHDELRPEELRIVAEKTPGVARALVRLYRRYRTGVVASMELAERLEAGAESLSEGSGTPGFEGSRLPSEEVSDFIQAQRNHFPALEEAAEALWEAASLRSGDLAPQLRAHLEQRLGVAVDTVRSEDTVGAVRRFDPERGRLSLSEILPASSTAFQLAHQIALLRHGDLLDSLLPEIGLSTPDSIALARVALANAFAGAVLMPYEAFLAAAQETRYDLEILQHRFHASFEQVCHRLTGLHRPGAKGVPFHMVRMDIAGNISKRFSASGIHFARYSGACPRWVVHAAFLTPAQIRTQISRMPDGTTYFCLARTVRKAGGGHRVPQNRLAIGLGCRLEHASELVYGDGLDISLENAPTTAVPVGVTCRLCERMDCRQRAFPPLHHRLDVDENLRGLSFYYSPPDAAG